MINIIHSLDALERPQKVTALRFDESEYQIETPFHKHYKCQLVMPINGYVKSRVKNKLWIVPKGCAVWIPSQVLHNNLISPGASVCTVFTNPDVISMPEISCTISVSPLLRELIIHLSNLDQDYQPGSSTDRAASVILDELINMPSEQLDFPVPEEPKLNHIAYKLLDNPADRRTIAEWATECAMSERSLARLVQQETKMSFGRWRGQLRALISIQKLAGGESVQAVAESLGYASVSAFITFFKSILGRSPMSYIRDKYL